MKKDQHVSPGIAITLILLSTLTLGTKFWADAQLSSLAYPSHLLVSPDNKLGVVIGEILFVIDKNNVVEEIDLTALGIKTLIGDIAFLSEHELLLRFAKKKTSILQNIQRYLRHTPHEGTPGTHPFEGKLVRCNVITDTCELFSEALPKFIGAFWLAVEKDTVYLADTNRHRLFKLDKRGNLLAKSEYGFRFPNQISTTLGSLWLANTNHHEIVELDKSTIGFGDKITIKNLYTLGITQSESWPIGFEFVDDSWWVLSKNRHLSRGGLFKFNNNWQLVKRVPLPSNADIIAILHWNNKVYATDIESRRIYRFNHEGDKFTLPKWKELESWYQSSDAHVDHYTMISRLGIISFFMVMLGGLAFAILQAKSNTVGLPDIRHTESSLLPTDPDITWISYSPLVKKVFTAVFLLYVTVFFAMLLLGLLLGLDAMPNDDTYLDDTYLEAINELGTVFATSAIILYITYKLIYKQKIGVVSDTLILVQGKKFASGSRSQIIYTTHSLGINGTFVILGNHNTSFFSKPELRDKVFPLLSDANEVSHSQMQMLLLQHHNPFMLFTLLLIVFLLIAVFSLL